MESSEDFLRKIFDLLKSGGVFDVHNDDEKKVVDFKYPDEMKVSLKVDRMVKFLDDFN